MSESRLLIPEDSGLVPLVYGIFSRRLDEIEPLYSGDIVEKARKRYTPDYFMECLKPDSEDKILGHFTDESLDGILIGGFDVDYSSGNPIDRSIIRWIMADVSGKGIGSSLINCAIDRAKSQDYDVMALILSAKNKGAKRLYEKMGFNIIFAYNNDTMYLMHKDIDKS
ncbi:MAG: GNAT family N-acetyltransferase [Nanoarchaeota archaeon]